MKTRIKRIGLALALLIGFAAVAGLLWKKALPPQIITLPNGETFQFVAAEWGTNDVQPTAAARFVSRLPPPIANFVVRKWGSRLGIVKPIGIPGFFWGFGPNPPPEPALHFWFRSLSTNAASTTNDFKFMLADKNGVVAGRGNGGWSSFGQGNGKWLTFTLPVVPRRSDMLQLLVFKADDQFNGPYSPIGTVRFPNPIFGHFPNWQPEPVPAIKTAGDLQVRLTAFRIAAQNRNGTISELNGTKTRFHPPAPGEDREVVFKLDIDSPRGTNEYWIIQPAELSDATGNNVRTDYFIHYSNTDEYYLGPALWPDESAWRLKLTLRRFRGHDPEEIVTFTNVSVPAVGASNTVFQTNIIHGVPVVLKQAFTREPDMAPVVLRGPASATHVVAELVNSPEGFVVDYKQMKADIGWTPGAVASTRTTNSATMLLYSIPVDVRTLDITWAVQKTRTVEFLVKPPKAE